MKSTIPRPFRAELTERITSLLGPGVDLPALAREMDDATSGIRTRSWHNVGAVTPGQVRQVLDITNWTGFRSRSPSRAGAATSAMELKTVSLGLGMALIALLGLNLLLTNRQRQADLHGLAAA